MGLLKITPSGWRKIKQVRFGSDEKQNARQDMTGLLGQLIAEDVLQIRAVANRGLWVKLTPSDIKVLEKTLKQKDKPNWCRQNLLTVLHRTPAIHHCV